MRKARQEYTLTLHQVADLIHVSQRRCQALVLKGKLPAKRFGPIWLVDEKQLEQLLKTWNRKPGKPRTIKIKE